MATVVHIRGEAPWLVWYDQASHHFVGRCDPLSLTASGPSQPELLAEVAESIQLLFADLLEAGDLAAFLHDRGWSQNVPVGADVDLSDLQFTIPTRIDFAEHGPH